MMQNGRIKPSQGLSSTAKRRWRSSAPVNQTRPTRWWAGSGLRRRLVSELHRSWCGVHQGRWTSTDGGSPAVVHRGTLLGVPHRSSHKMVTHTTVHSSVVLVLLTKNFIKLVSQLDELLYFVKCMHEYMFLNLHACLKLWSGLFHQISIWKNVYRILNLMHQINFWTWCASIDSDLDALV